MRQVGNDLARMRAAVDREDGEDGAELDQHLEGARPAVEAEEVAREQQMASGRDGNELGQTLDQAEDERVNAQS